MAPEQEVGGSPLANPETVPAHEVDEDPEQFLGKLIKDPWNDDTQEDWPNADLEVEVSE